MGWDGMGWDEMGWDGIGWDGMENEVSMGLFTIPIFPRRSSSHLLT